MLRSPLKDADRVLILAVDDESSVVSLVERALAQPGLDFIGVSDPLQVEHLIDERHPDIVIADLVMPGRDGMALLEYVTLHHPEIDFVLLTGNYSARTAVEAIQKGACDYLTKPIDVPRFRERIDSMIAAVRLRKRAARVEMELLDVSRFEGLIGHSPEMLEVFSTIRKIAPHCRTCLITGATGTGKELAARALHQMGPLSSGPFVVCNCAAVVETLFESELFGHVKGSFTGAHQDRQGLFEAAEGGTLFLDEIGEMTLTTQTKLLRALQFKEIRRVGASTTRRVNVNLIAATNRDLRGMVQERQFREDLFYRLALVQIHLPSLLERKEDLPLLTAHFVDLFSRQFGKSIKGLTARARAVLAHYGWPGNVRELENTIGHACMMTSRDTIDVADLPVYVRSAATERPAYAADLLPLAEIEKRHARYVLEKVDGNKAMAADILGISRTTLYKLIGDD